MSGTTMVVLIVAIVFISLTVTRIFDNKKSKKQQVDNDDIKRLLEINEQLNAKVTALQTRVANLEAIVTQEGYDLKSKINSL